MIDHTGIGVADVARSAAFYDAALRALGLRRAMQTPENDGADGVGYGVDYPVFWIDRFHPHGVKQHTAFAAKSRAQVDAFHAAALKAGGIDNGRPGLRDTTQGYPPGYYAAFVRQQLLGTAAALDIPYEFLTGDMSKVNGRLMRVILNEFHRILEQSQWLLTIPQVCDPIWTNFIDMAVLAGALDAPDYATRRREYLKVEWRPQRWEYIHPVQDVQARQMEVEAGFTSRSAVVAERGDSAEEVDRQNAEDQQRARSLGLAYKTSNAPAPEPDQRPAE